jgi:hypothetical protein
VAPDIFAGGTKAMQQLLAQTLLDIGCLVRLT